MLLLQPLAEIWGMLFQGHRGRLFCRKKTKITRHKPPRQWHKDRPVANHFDWALQHSLRRDNTLSEAEFYGECVGADGGA